MSTNSNSFISFKNIKKELITNTKINDFLGNKNSILLSKILKSKSKPYIIRNTENSISIKNNYIISKENIKKKNFTERQIQPRLDINNRNNTNKIYQTNSEILYKRKLHIKNSFENNSLRNISNKSIITRAPVVINFNNLNSSLGSINTTSKNNESKFEISLSKENSKEKKYCALRTSTNVRQCLINNEKNEIFRSFEDLKKKSEQIFRRKLRKHNNSHRNFRIIRKEKGSLSEIKRKLNEISRSRNKDKNNSSSINLFDINNTDYEIKKKHKVNKYIINNNKDVNLFINYYTKNKSINDINKTSYYEKEKNDNNNYFNFFNGESNKYKNQQVNKQKENITNSNDSIKIKKNIKNIPLNFRKIDSNSKISSKDENKRNLNYSKNFSGNMGYRENKYEKLNTIPKIKDLLRNSRHSSNISKCSNTLPSILEEEEKMKLKNDISKNYNNYLAAIELFNHVLIKLKIKNVKDIFKILCKIKKNKEISKENLIANKSPYIHKRIVCKSFNKKLKK